MKDRDLKAHIASLEKMLQKFREAKERGKETNTNEVRAQSIQDIEEITKKLEVYIRNNPELLQLIAGTENEPDIKISWDDIVRPEHFEKDLQEEIRKLKGKVS